jgi:endonuclease YncB( thermonuclease family)
MPYCLRIFLLSPPSSPNGHYRRKQDRFARRNYDLGQGIPQAFGNRAKQLLSDLCFGKNAACETQDIGRYARIMAAVTCAGVSLEQIQMLCGHGSERITAVHVKCRCRSTVQPNKIDMGKAG